MHKTSAWPLALIYVGLIFYASLYPFSDWRDQGIVPWAFLTSPLPKYWTGFDVAINVLGYMPLGFLLVLSALRSGRAPYAVVLATLLAGLLSLSMESLQGYLPDRVPSNVDLSLNTLGAWLGGLMAWSMEKLGVIDRWSRFRARWFVADARGGLVLLALWPLALLFPASVPFGLGQVMERLEAAVAEALQDTPFLDWLPVRDIELQPLVPGIELVCVALGLLIPCLLGFCIIRSVARRALFGGLVFALGVGVTALSAALSYGPEHAWAWFTLPVEVGLVAALVLVVLLLWAPRRASASLMLLALGIYLSLLNQAPASPYLAQTLATWEQGRFIRFHGLAQWLGWLWPYAALVYVLTQVWGRDPKN
ncbi:MAG: VanZ family protein [Rhodoferax sp.]|uniref:VanZ family protein n=1 Tax=Rhodoferax sp. TaxID=50421 RepID=UPI0017DB161E|nr:VanZ family protein [Rhodoferax sp.]NMM14789.1 VanZ family protein [Rhodoferax sp.]NMM18552.1 VanZ family protein [Rhodoferax sp.]